MYIVLPRDRTHEFWAVYFPEFPFFILIQMLVFASVWQASRLICRFLTQLSRNKIDQDTCCSFEETTIYNHIFFDNIQLSTQIIPIYTPRKTSSSAFLL